MQLGGTDFDTDEEIEEALLHFLRGLVGDRYDSKIKKWVHRVQKCIDRNEEYVEKNRKMSKLFENAQIKAIPSFLFYVKKFCRTYFTNAPRIS